MITVGSTGGKPGRRRDRGRPARDKGDRHGFAGANASQSPFRSRAFKDHPAQGRTLRTVVDGRTIFDAVAAA